MQSLPKRATVREVGPRDGFQMEADFIPTDRKIRIVDALSATGIRRIEATSFVHPRAIPQLRDAAEVMGGIARRPGTAYEALVPNPKGAERAVAAGADAVLIVISASDAHNRANINMTVQESVAQIPAMVEIAKRGGVPVTGAIACSTGCPYTGRVPAERVRWVAEGYVAAGVDELVIADSLGMGNPAMVYRLVAMVKDCWPDMPVAVHIHNTRGMGLANVIAALQAGVTVIDGAVGGLGGCPFAPGATGNIPTEDLVHMLDEMGIETGVDLDGLLEVARLVKETVGHDLPGIVLRAGKSTRTYPMPAALLAPEGAKGGQDVAALRRFAN